MKKNTEKMKTMQEAREKADAQEQADRDHRKAKLTELKELLTKGARYFSESELNDWCLHPNMSISPHLASQLAEDYDIGLVRVPHETNPHKWDGAIVMRLTQFKSFLQTRSELERLQTQSA